MALTLLVMLSGMAWLALAVRLYFVDDYSMKEKLAALGSASLRAVLVLNKVCAMKRVKNLGEIFFRQGQTQSGIISQHWRRASISGIPFPPSIARQDLQARLPVVGQHPQRNP